MATQVKHFAIALRHDFVKAEQLKVVVSLLQRPRCPFAVLPTGYGKSFLLSPFFPSVHD